MNKLKTLDEKVVAKMVNLSYEHQLDDKKIEELKKEYSDCPQFTVVLACIKNNLKILEDCIENGVDISICNGHVLRYTVSEGFVGIARLLLKCGIDP